MKRPSFQFYPADWRSNTNLRWCSWAARGAWIEIISLMHDSDEYGVLRRTLKEIAEAIGCQQKLVNELAAKGVLKGCDKGKCEPFIYRARHAGREGPPTTLIEKQDGPIWYSSRLVRDEHIKAIKGGNTRFSHDKSE